MTVQNSSLLFSANVTKHLPMVVGGDGNYLLVEDPHTKEKRRIFDAVGGAAVCALGHHDEDIVQEMAEAAKACTYSFPASLTNYYAEELAKFYIDESPEGAFAAALWTSSGSESNENAMKLVRQYYQEKGELERTIFVSRKQSYHGYTIGALSLGHSARQAPYKDIILPEEQTPKVSQVYPYRGLLENETLEQYNDRLLEEVEQTFIKYGTNKIAAFVCETLSGSTYGTAPSIPGYLAGLRKLCDKYGILLWLDEVMCGTGRASATGGLNCWESFPDFSGPDIQTVGKTLGSGYVTIAGVLVSPKVKKVFAEGSATIAGAQTYHQHSFNCRVALAVQKKIAKMGLRKNMYTMGTHLGNTLKERAASAKYKIIGDVRGLGGFWSIEIVKDRNTKEPFPPSLGVGGKVAAKCLQNGMTAMGLGATIDGKKGDHVSVAPSFIINEDDVEFIVSTLLSSVAEVQQDLQKLGEL